MKKQNNITATEIENIIYNTIKENSTLSVLPKSEYNLKKIAKETLRNYKILEYETVEYAFNKTMEFEHLDIDRINLDSMKWSAFLKLCTEYIDNNTDNDETDPRDFMGVFELVRYNSNWENMELIRNYIDNSKDAFTYDFIAKSVCENEEIDFEEIKDQLPALIEKYKKTLGTWKTDKKRCFYDFMADKF